MLSLIHISQIIEQELDKAYQKGTSQNQPGPSPRVKRILENALVTARKLGYEFISPEHILLALNDEGEGIGSRILAKLGVKKEDSQTHARIFRCTRQCLSLIHI